MSIVFYSFIFVLCIISGKLVSKLIYNIPRKINLFKSFLRCPSGEHYLPVKNNIPLFGQLLTSGKCEKCGATVFAQSLFLEAATGVAGLLFIFLPFMKAALCFVTFCVLLSISIIDAKTKQIPDSLNIALAVCGAFSAFMYTEIALAERFIGIFVVSLPLFILSLFIRGAFGFGDVKLMLCAGFLLGWKNNLVGFFIAILIGGVYGAILLLTHKKARDDHFAFGPCLATGILTMLLFGEKIIDWYFSLIL
jgi:leader peptidase (prepilin peptidase)/N-methyltransferase